MVSFSKFQEFFFCKFTTSFSATFSKRPPERTTSETAYSVYFKFQKRLFSVVNLNRFSFSSVLNEKGHKSRIFNYTALFTLSISAIYMLLLWVTFISWHFHFSVVNSLKHFLSSTYIKFFVKTDRVFSVPEVLQLIFEVNLFKRFINPIVLIVKLTCVICVKDFWSY